MERPWFKLWSRDWLDNKELRRCSPTARAILIDLMCLAHEGTPYGHLADDVGALAENYMAARCIVTAREFTKGAHELLQHKCLQVDPSGVLYVPRMVEDDALRSVRSEAGAKGGKQRLLGDLLKQNLKQTVKQTVKQTPRARADSDSDSCFVSSFSENQIARAKPQSMPSSLFLTWWKVWADARGTNHRMQAEAKFFDRVTPGNEGACFECTISYLGGPGANPAKGYNPENFLEEQSRDGFAARWPVSVPVTDKNVQRHEDTLSAMKFLSKFREVS